MKYGCLLFLLSFVFLFSACSQDDAVPVNREPEFVAYEMVAGSTTSAFGTVTFNRHDGGGVEVTITLENTVPGAQHPAHLHYGEATEETTLMAAMLSPVDGDTGVSITVLEGLMESEEFTYEDVRNFNGHIKVHLDAGAGYTTTLAIGNIGANATPVSEN